MPSLVARRNCNATISSSPLQGVALNTASSGRDDRAGFVILLQPHLGNSSSRAREFTSNRSDYVRAIVSSTEPLLSALKRPAWSARSATFPSNKPNEPAGSHTSSLRWKAPTPLRFALGAATLSRSRYHGDDF
jgi:hypothetical protein